MPRVELLMLRKQAGSLNHPSAKNKLLKALLLPHVENLFVRAWKGPNVNWLAKKLNVTLIAESIKPCASGTANG